MARIHSHESNASRRSGSSILLATALLLAGCASSGDVERIRQEREQAKAKMRAELQQEQALAATMEKESEARKASAEKLTKALGGSAQGKPAAKLGATASSCSGSGPCFSFITPVSVASQGVYAVVFGQDPVSNIYYYFDGTTWNQVGTIAPSSITLCPPQSVSCNPFYLSLPSTQFITGGAIVISIGGTLTITPVSSTLSVPTPSTNPTNIFGVFEFAYLTGSPNNSLNIDISEVDQVGFPFTVTTNPPPPDPNQQGVGIPLGRQTFFQNFQTYVTTGAGQAFSEGYNGLTVGNTNIVTAFPTRIVAPQDILVIEEALPGGSPTMLAFNPPTQSPGGSLQVGTMYYYKATATYNNNGTTVESAPSTGFQNFQPYNGSYASQPTNFATGTLSLTLPQAAFPYATGYNLYRSTSPTGPYYFLGTLSMTTPCQMTGFNPIQTVPPPCFTDDGSVTPTSQQPPTNNYGYFPLTTYYTNAIQTFFNQYTAPNSFTINVDGTTWTGNTTTLNGYTVLQLTGRSGGTYANNVVNIYQPFFSTNTNQNIPNITSYPPAPTWLTSPTESPARMVFACDGVFGSGPYDPNPKSPGKTVTNDVENPVCSAFNRGLATNFKIIPNNWANLPLFTSASATTATGGSLSGTYYYVMTSLDANNNESTPSIELQATVSGGNNSVQLNWSPVGTSVANAFNIYRGTAPGQENVLVTTITNTGAVMCATSTKHNCVTDTGGGTTNTSPPYQYYAPGSTSNFYSAFLHQNFTTNPGSGISINGQAYGYAYDDQGGMSTDLSFNAPFPTVTITIGNWNQ